MKILFVATHPGLGVGYSRVANKISNYLVSIPGNEVFYYASQWYRNQIIEDVFIDERIQMFDPEYYERDTPCSLGVNGLQDVIRLKKPDCLFIYNDPRTIVYYLDAIPPEIIPEKIYLYIDILYPWERLLYFSNIKHYKITQIFTFLDTWTNHLIDDLKFKKELVTTLPHGVDFEDFRYIPTNEAKKLFGIEPDDFLIINMNSNTNRKMLDITIRSFITFIIDMKLNPKIKLYLGSFIRKRATGVHLVEMAVTECLRKNIDPNILIKNNFIFNDKPTQKTMNEMNIIFHAADVGINTCCGEGFGLVQVEHAYCNKPQIVTKLDVFKETLGIHGFFADTITSFTVAGSTETYGHCYIPNENDIVKHMKYIYENKNHIPESKEYIKAKYPWKNAYKVLDAFFRN